MIYTRLKSEDEVLDPETRKKIIDEINGDENITRKREAFRRYESFKDLTRKYVIEKLLQQFDPVTVKEMDYAIANVSLVKKVINKLARVYANGVKRDVVDNSTLTTEIEALAKELNFNTAMKKTNRFLKLQNNVEFYIKPCPIEETPGVQKYTLKLQPLSPYLYDVVEDFYDRERPLVYILSNFKNNATTVKYTTGDASTENRGYKSTQWSGNDTGDDKDQIIADTPSDAGPKDEYIWWTDKYHFTTNCKGEIVSTSAEMDNPILQKPFVSFAKDQDGQYWSLGGNDLIDAAILVNSLISHMNDLGVRQGHGQFYMKGKNLPRNLVTGPSKVVLLEYENDDPVPEIGYAQSSPQLADLRANVEQYVALTLTTNNLSTSGVATALGGTQNLASGIALVIDKAESMEDVKDQEQIFLDKEPEIWEIIGKWLDVYGSKGLLVEDLSQYKIPAEIEMNIQFNPAQSIQSEGEKLDNLVKRKDLGINTMVEIMQIDNPDLTEKQAVAKLKLILQEKIEKQMTFATKTGDTLSQVDGVPGQPTPAGVPPFSGPIGGGGGVANGAAAKGNISAGNANKNNLNA